ncbi:hypothetical protein SAMN05880574_11520 [Chryseobacterium sp. RU37D]|uniref:hypothetical protein n=1 Tax=Chryseobacterium sp. RU37D TaxID=1907397 RepID=UPI00095472F0|nr:hypothetical protein [Chryseobacterium sp. RU37D]SIQ51633.1 hypothetical protein SAMN05880574_11520 [Chryseobacterium sp. RU37D]
MKKTILFSAMIFGSLAFAQKTPVLGGDKDAHGCKGSAGYTYSQIKNDCVRVFEQKIQLNEVKSEKGYTTGTAVIFNKNMSKAEVFIPDGSAKSIILERQGKSKSWKSGSHIKNSYVLVPYKKSYQIKKDNVVIYQ